MGEERNEKMPESQTMTTANGAVAKGRKLVVEQGLRAYARGFAQAAFIGLRR